MSRAPVATGLVIIAATAFILIPGPGIDGDGPGNNVRIPVSEAGIDWRPPQSPTASEPGPASIDAVYPNPVPPNDHGEYLVISFGPEHPGSTWTLTDNETTVTIPRDGRVGTVIITTTPARLRNQTDRPVIGVTGALSLANGGERLTIRRNGTPIDTITYPSVGEHDLYTADGRIRPRNASQHPVRTFGGVTASVFVLPDAAHVPGTTLGTANRRLYLAGYTLTSTRIASLLVAAAARGVDVRVLLEGGPAGGLSQRTASLIPRLRRAGVTVRMVDGPQARWRFHHAKYAVVDDRAIVLTENWQPAGTGGKATRGWGTVVRDRGFADRLATVFRRDHGYIGTRSWSTVRSTSPLQPPSPASETFYPRFAPVSTGHVEAELLIAPDNAERRLLALLRNATESIRVLQPTIGNRTPLLAAVVNAARRGVKVQLLLGGTWFMQAENTYLRDRLRRIARREGLPLAIRLIDPRSRFEYLHAKGVIVDGDQVVVGSINWNTVSTRENREVAVLLDSRRLATHYRRVFRADWRGAAWRLPIMTGVVAVLSVLVAVVGAGRAIRFDGQPGARRRVQRRPSSRRGRQAPDRASRERT